jgi:hypothetical protein
MGPSRRPVRTACPVTVGAAKAGAGRARRATSAVGPLGRLPGLSGFAVRAVHFAPRALRAAHDAGEPDYEACTACTPPHKAAQPGASHARRARPAPAFARRGWDAVALTGHRRCRRAAWGTPPSGRGRRRGSQGCGRRAQRAFPTDSPASCAARSAEQSGRRARIPRTAGESPCKGDRRGRPDGGVPQAARALHLHAATEQAPGRN